MPETPVSLTVRPANPTICFIDIQGDITAAAEPAMMAAYTQAAASRLRVLILNFTGLAYMNSLGIGLLVTLLIRMNRQKQHLLAYGLSDHYRRIFALTRLDDAIAIYDTEALALIAAARLPE
jgi:anti-sigma B factor antagonist